MWIALEAKLAYNLTKASAYSCCQRGKVLRTEKESAWEINGERERERGREEKTQI